MAPCGRFGYILLHEACWLEVSLEASKRPLGLFAAWIFLVMFILLLALALVSSVFCSKCLSLARIIGSFVIEVDVACVHLTPRPFHGNAFQHVAQNLIVDTKALPRRLRDRFVDPRSEGVASDDRAKER